MNITYQTSDGYTFHLVGGQWVDSLDPNKVDMTFTLEAMAQYRKEEQGEHIELANSLNTFNGDI